MSEDGYIEEEDAQAEGRWRCAVASAIRGRRGQAMLADLVKALDALEEKNFAQMPLQLQQGR